MTQDEIIRKFVSELFLLYPLGKEFSTQDAVSAKVRQYCNLLRSSKAYDYDKLLELIGLEYKYKHTPEISWIIELRNARCEIYAIKEEQVFCVFFESGLWLEFITCNFGTPKKDIKENLEKVYGKIKTTKLFPPKTTIMQGDIDNTFNIYLESGEKRILTV